MKKSNGMPYDRKRKRGALHSTHGDMEKTEKRGFLWKILRTNKYFPTKSSTFV